VKTEVAKAVDQIRRHYGFLRVDVIPSPCGGAYVLIHDLPLGLPYSQATTWMGFFITNACPFADTYPFYARADLARADGAALRSPPFHPGKPWAPDLPGFAARPAVMISRRQNHTQAWGLETPLLKLQTVIAWMLDQ
jgi:hypothetical protein